MNSYPLIKSVLSFFNSLTNKQLDQISRKGLFDFYNYKPPPIYHYKITNCNNCQKKLDELWKEIENNEMEVKLNGKS
jgi:hypothetical protein